MEYSKTYTKRQFAEASNRLSGSGSHSMPAVPVLQKNPQAKEPTLQSKVVTQLHTPEGKLPVQKSPVTPWQTHGTDEQYLPHEAWHVVQQKQGSVKTPMQMKSKLNVYDNTVLEREADVIEAKTLFENGQVISDKSENGVVGQNSESPAVTQLKPVLGKITWGVTHAAKEVNGSIYGDGDYAEGEIGPWGELKAGEIVTVDDDDLFMSRRGANQEVEKIREEDRRRQPLIEWIKALRIKGIDVRKLNVFIRSETIHIGKDVLDPEAQWTKVTVEDVHWNDEVMLKGVKAIGDEYEKATEGRPEKVTNRNICSTEEMDQDDEGLDVANDFQIEKYRDLTGYGPQAQTKIARKEGKTLIGVMQIAVQGHNTNRYLYVKWLLGSRSSKGAGVALVRSALEYAIQNAIMKVKVESAMSAVDWYEKRGFSKVGNTQHMNDGQEQGEESIDCGCADMELQFYWDKA